MPAPNVVSDAVPAATPNYDGFVSAEELLQRIPISAGTLANWRKAGLIPFVKLGRRVIFHIPSVTEALLRLQRGGDL